MCTKATWRGQTVCAHSVPKYDAWAVSVGQSIKLVAIRGSYSNFASSAGTDTGGGHLDVEMDGYDHTRQVQTETDGRAQILYVELRLWAGNNHCHSLDPDCPDLSPEACQQFEDFRNDLNGLAVEGKDLGDRTHAAAILYAFDHRLDSKDPATKPLYPVKSTRPLPWKGVDVSRYTSLDTVKADATADDFELVMCTEGKGYNAPAYGTEMGLVRAGSAHAGAVHYAWPENGWKADYDHFKATAGLRTGEAGALDFEPWHTSQPNADPATFPAYLVGWANAYKADFGVDPLFYAPDYFVNQIKSHATPEQWARIAALPFWKAGKNGAYVTDPSVGPGDSLGFNKIAAWQWSDKPLDQDFLYVPWSSIAVGGTSDVGDIQLVSYPTPTPAPTATSSATTYVVKSGDTLSGIAAKYHVSVAQLVSWNHIANPDVIQVGEHIRLTAPTSSTGIVHVVQSGETLGGIAARYHVTVAQLASWNHITNVNLIYPGQRLRIGSTSAPAPVAHRYYTVQRGDALSSIAAKFNVSLASLVSWNGIKNADLIYPGQRLRVS